MKSSFCEFNFKSVTIIRILKIILCTDFKRWLSDNDFYLVLHLVTVYWKESFHSQESTTMILSEYIFHLWWVGIISSYSDRMRAVRHRPQQFFSNVFRA